MSDEYCHSSSIRVDRPAEVVFSLMSDGLKQGHWAWGSFQREAIENQTFCGTSVFTGKKTYVKLLPDLERMIVDYEVGGSLNKMQFRNMSRVIEGQVLGLPADSCVVSLLTWRLASQDDYQWKQMSTVHEAEMYLIRGLAERGLP
ncbi:hypothetical protein ACGYLI_15685 [Sulfitobacter sp. 1A13421]|uniref:hypothetical protein n=1 Tax=Sulfitobacter sp. 1A13421 TaxID=3368595 RepID=UPI0037462182